ncbi:MAG: hypothetical protein SPJ19_06980 [Candidatus Borkfalkiaceae bacterium]|nr:hypothetical protein [Christensenellaceae bacterium]
MEIKGYHIISLEAKDIYEQELINGVKKGFVLPSKNDRTYFGFFKNVLDYSLDLIELEKCYQKKYRNNKFFFEDEYKNKYTLTIINLKFTYTYKDENNEKDLKQLREHFYNNGFNLGGVHYVRYKRSSGSSRQGKCLFIDEKLLKAMEKWGECGLKPTGDLASWESYKSLSLSSLKGTIDIPLNGILFIQDCKSEFFEEVVSVEEKDGVLVATTKETTIENDIWDGESLLDKSLFSGNYTDKHMLLLRNKFFKSCAFRTKLQKWFKDKNITLDDLKARGFITLATDISQIVMVTTPNSMKFLKFMGDELTEYNVRKWVDKVDSTFGVVKYDKRTKFLGGKMVQTSYQFINTLGFTEGQVEELLQPSKDYLTTIRNDYDFMRYHFSDAYKREESDETEELSDGLAERSDVIFTLMGINYDFKDTKLYYNFRNDVVESQKDRLKQGHILLPGTNATLFGNGPEMLMALSGEFDINNTKNTAKVLDIGEIACKKFGHGEKLVCARSPHITMGNLYGVTNNLSGDIWNYFDLGENIVCVNAIGENIQQRLNGCDYDSDTMLITNDKLIVETAFKQKDLFKVPVCGIKSGKSKKKTLAELDHSTSENKIGNIVNLSQKLNSILWDKLNSGEYPENVQNIYKDVCKLAVLSGIEIDKAKRAYDSVRVSKEIDIIAKKYNADAPEFFQEIVVSDSKREKKHTFYDAPMEYVYKSVKGIDYRTGKDKQKTYIAISDMLKEPETKSTSTVYDKKRKIINACEEYEQKLKLLYQDLRLADEDEKDIIYEKIRQTKEERNKQVKELLSEEYVLYLVIKDYEKEERENWHIYAPLLENELFKKMLKASKEKMPQVIQKDDGEYDLYGLKFTKIN